MLQSVKFFLKQYFRTSINLDIKIMDDFLLYPIIVDEEGKTLYTSLYMEQYPEVNRILTDSRLTILRFWDYTIKKFPEECVQK